MTSWHERILDDERDVAALVRSLKRVAVLGIKTEAQANQPAFYVPKALADGGIEIVPVPVYYPDAATILGKPVVRRVVDAGQPLDCVDVFRRPSDLPAHLDDLIASKPASVWMQQGIRHDAVAEALAKAGITVVQDCCLMVDFRRWGGG